MDSRKDFHGRCPWIDALEFFVDVENAAELAAQLLRRDMRQVEIDALPVFFNGQPFVHANVENLAGLDVARHKVLVLRVALLKKIETLIFRDRERVARVLWLPRHPHAPSFATGRLTHQSQLVRAGDRRGVNLDEFAVAEFRADLKAATGRATGAGHRHRRATIDEPGTAASDDDRIGCERLDLHRDQILSHRTSANAVVVEHRAKKVPELKLANLAVAMPAANLLVQSI